jgi:hypothetical protein
MWHFTLLALLALTVLVSGQAPAQPAPPKPVEVPVTPELIAELQRALAEAIQRFEAMDEAGVLANFSERYRSRALTKAIVRQQLRAMFATHDSVRARVRIGEVRMIGDRVWVSSTGEVTGRLRFLGTQIPILVWTDAWEVAGRENGRWRLTGE